MKIEKNEDVIDIQEEVEIKQNGEKIILEKGDRVKVLSETVFEIESILDSADFPYVKVEKDQSSRSYTVIYQGMAIGRGFQIAEEKFFDLFPNGEINGWDIFLQGKY